MEDNLVTYIGEHLAIGNWGKLAVYVAMAAALFSVVCYFLALKNPGDKFWRNLGRAGFFTHTAAVLSIFVILFVIIQKHYFEYQYAWQHSSRDLPLKYMISCFWEGQEGSFLLWMVWHAVIGNILIATARTWESPVMAIMSLAQVMLATMLLGIEFLGAKIGSSPFDLLRDKVAGPIFSRPDYLSFIKDGNGLNPLLQNYWMVIHPPTLFFGFAVTIVPFAFAVSALWTRRYTDWVKPALPWALVGVMVLGTGIIMGGFWAYESLSFGGYWAWDPVENASLIPWLILIAAVHLMLIYKSTGNALYSTYLLSIFSFVLVLYATFLTRSGILGNTSVHAFTDLGMSGQLLIFLFIFIWLPSYVTIQNKPVRYSYLGLTVILFILSFKYGASQWVFIPYSLLTLYFFFRNIYVVNPIKGKEEEFSSREFWMFIGSLVFLISCLHVLISTSMPVINKLVGTNTALPEDVVGYYNQWQLPFALIIAVLTAITQFFKYKKTQQSFYFNNIIVSLTISILVTTACIYLFKIKAQDNTKLLLYILFLLASVYTIVANVFYVIKVLKGKISFSGASVAHIGFGLLLVGVLISSANKQVISLNYSEVDFGENFDQQGQREHLLLYKNSPMRMGEYEVTYLGDSVAGVSTLYKLSFVRMNEKGEYGSERFYLYPHVIKNPKTDVLSVNPDTRHYLTHDVFTHVSMVSDKKSRNELPYERVYNDTIQIGDTIYTNNAKLVMDGMKTDDTKGEGSSISVTAHMRVLMLNDTLHITPQFILDARVGDQVSPEVELPEAGLMIRFANIFPPNEKTNTQAGFHFAVAERAMHRDYVVLMAKVFPYINLVWGGTIVMIIGFLISIVRRVKEYRREVLRT
jgi:cytochrome c-type biogenesis protein CcmF